MPGNSCFVTVVVDSEPIFDFAVSFGNSLKANDIKARIAKTCSQLMAKQNVPIEEGVILNLVKVLDHNGVGHTPNRTNFTNKGDTIAVVFPTDPGFGAGHRRPYQPLSEGVVKPKNLSTEEWSLRVIAEATVPSPHPQLHEYVQRLAAQNVQGVPSKRVAFVNFCKSNLKVNSRGKLGGPTDWQLVDQLWHITTKVFADASRGQPSVSEHMIPETSGHYSGYKRLRTLEPPTVRPLTVGPQTTGFRETGHSNDEDLRLSGHQYRASNDKTVAENIDVFSETIRRYEPIGPFPDWSSAATSGPHTERQSITNSETIGRSFRYTFFVLYEDSSERIKISVDDGVGGAKLDEIIQVIKHKFGGRGPPKRRAFEVFDENSKQFVRIDDYLTPIPNLSLIRVLAEPDIQTNEFDEQRRQSVTNTVVNEEIRSEDKPRIERTENRTNFWIIASLKELNDRFNRSDDIWEEVSQEMNYRLPDQSITANECQIRFCRLFCKYSSVLKTANSRPEAVDSFEFFEMFSDLNLKPILAKTDCNLLNEIRNNIYS